MKNYIRNDDDDWNAAGSKITSPEKLLAIKNTLDDDGPVIVEHWHYRMGCSPSRLIFEDFEEFVTWLNEKTKPGDAVDVWSWSNACKYDRRLAEGKCPDEQGMVPRRGAY